MIDRVEIKGYKSIRELGLDLAPINILIGSNGVGKSNFISFFKFLNTVYEQRLEQYSLKYGADDTLCFGRKNTERLSADIKFDDRNAYAFVLHATNDNKLFVDAEFISFNRGVFGYKTWKNELINSNNREAKIKVYKSGIAAYVRNYLESFRVYHFHDTSENAPLRTYADINDNQFLRENGSNLPAFLYYLQQVHSSNFKRIEKAVQSIAPFFERFQLHPQRLNEQRISLEWIEKNHPDRYFNAAHLSDGTIRFIALAALLLQPEPPDVIIIDEPELGLHPVAINKLSGMLRSAVGKKSQVIISTQSVSLVNNFNPAEIITVDREGDESSFVRLEQDQLKQWLEDYSIGDLWSKSVIKGQP
jgi:predicted ATPase